MRAWTVTDTAAPDGLSCHTVATPEPGDRLLVEVQAAGVGFPDLLMRRGEFQIPQATPFTLGWEAAGIVAAAPAGSRFRLGDQVVTMSFGAFADHVAADEGATFALPAGWSAAEGAAFPLNWFTALAATRRGRVRPGDAVLVQGAAGGVGTAALQLVGALGARPIAVVSSPAKAEVARAAGAHEVIVAGESWRQQLRELAPGGVDVVLDPVGGDRFLDGLRSLRSEGRYVVIGFADGTIPTLPVNRLLYNNLEVSGCTWSVLGEHEGGLVAAAHELGRLAAEAGIRPLVGQRFAFDDLPAAIDALADRRATGKLVLEVAAGG